MFRLKRTCVQGKTPLRFRLNALAFEVKRTCVFFQTPKRFLRGYIFFLKQQKKNVIPEVRKTPESLCGNDIPYFNLSLAAHSHARHLKYPKISSLHLLFLLHQLRHLHIALRTVHFTLDFHVELNLRFCSGRTYGNFCTVGCKELKYV